MGAAELLKALDGMRRSPLPDTGSGRSRCALPGQLPAAPVRGALLSAWLVFLRSPSVSVLAGIRQGNDNVLPLFLLLARGSRRSRGRRHVAAAVLAVLTLAAILPGPVP
jgi:hypothetical protein